MIPEKWTGELIGKMHNNRINYDDVAAEMGVTKSYISKILNGSRNPKGAQQRMEAAVDRLMRRKREEG